MLRIPTSEQAYFVLKSIPANEYPKVSGKKLFEPTTTTSATFWYASSAFWYTNAAYLNLAGNLNAAEVNTLETATLTLMQMFLQVNLQANI